jgi:hypothetical protein
MSITQQNTLVSVEGEGPNLYNCVDLFAVGRPSFTSLLVMTQACG